MFSANYNILICLAKVVNSVNVIPLKHQHVGTVSMVAFCSTNRCTEVQPHRAASITVDSCPVWICWEGGLCWILRVLATRAFWLLHRAWPSVHEQMFCVHFVPLALACYAIFWCHLPCWVLPVVIMHFCTFMNLFYHFCQRLFFVYGVSVYLWFNVVSFS